MARKAQENPQLDMTPMIDVVFELIIFFVVTLVEAQKKDETIELADGKHGIVLTPEELPPMHMMIDVGLRKGKPRISIGDRDITPAEIGRRVKERMQKIIMLTVLAHAIATNAPAANSDLFAKELLEREIASQYKLGALLSR